jgi:hypothetical protein
MRLILFRLPHTPIGAPEPPELWPRVAEVHRASRLTLSVRSLGLREDRGFMCLAGRYIPDRSARRRNQIEFVRLLAEQLCL